MLYLGLDGGGTKTEAALCDTDGHILRHVLEDETAPSSMTEEALTAVLQRLFSRLNLPAEEISCFAGISGCVKAWDRAVFERCAAPVLPPNVRMTVQSDSICALNAAVGPGRDGLLLIVGTGSVAFMRKGGECSEIGGWGYLVGDEGSGYDMGRRAISTALRAHDGRGPETLLISLLETKSGMDIDTLTDAVYEGGRKAIASFAGELIRAAELGDAPALKQLDECVEELCLHIRVAQKRMPIDSVIFSGGLISHFPFFRDRLFAALPGIRPVVLRHPPVYGAVLEALGHVPPGFEENFDRDWNVLQNQ